MTPLGKAITLGLLTGLLGILVSLSDYGIGLEEDFGLGFLFELRGKRQPPPEVVVISLDRRSANSLNLPPDPRKWPRSYHARLIEKLTHDGARVIYFDMVFKDRGQGDALFARAIQKAGNVVLAEYIERETIPLEKGQSGEGTTEMLVEKVTPPIPALEQQAVALAAFPLPKTPVRLSQYWTFKDGPGGFPTAPVVVLHIFASHVFDDFVNLLKKTLTHPNLAQAGQDPKNRSALIAAKRLINLQNQETGINKNVHETIRSMKEILGEETFLYEMMMKEFEIPKGRYAEVRKSDPLRAVLKTYKGDSHYLNFYGPPHTITTVPYVEALQLAPKAAVTGNTVNFQGKAVFIGITDLDSSTQKDGFHTVFTQPNGLDLSGVEICATAFANLLEDFPVQPLDPSVHLLLVLIWGIAIGMIWFLLPPVIAMGSSLVSILFMVGISYTQFKMAGIWFPLITPTFVQVPFAGFVAILWKYVETSGERDVIRKAFGYYVPDEVVNQVLKSLGNFKTGAQLVHGTCLYTDVEDYTSLSEKMKPEILQALMNDYYETIFAPVKQHGGIVLEVKGDSMFAIWATTNPNPKLRARACSAAIEVAHTVDRFNQSSHLKLHTRLCLHCGEVLLGNVGGGAHYEYTAIGDIINTASRIDRLNKRLGTRLLVASEVLEGLDGFLTREIGAFVLAGKARPLVVHELIGRTEDCNGDQKRLCKQFSNALDLFRKQQWPDAREKFAEILTEDKADGPSRFYLNLCKDLGDNPPWHGWDGTLRLDKK